MFTFKSFDIAPEPTVDLDAFKGVSLDLSFREAPTIDPDLTAFDFDIDSLVFEPVAITSLPGITYATGGASASGTGFASAGFSGSVSGSGFSSISVSASSYVGPNGQSSSSISVDATGDAISGSGFAAAGGDFDSFDFGAAGFANKGLDLFAAPRATEPIEFEPIDLSAFTFDGLF